MQIIENTQIISSIRDKFLRLDSEGKYPLDASAYGRKCAIYMIINLINNKKYIGKTVHLLNRANNYIAHTRDVHSRDSRILVQDMRKYGIENFRMFPLAVVKTRKELAVLEKYYVLQYNTLTPNGYNMNIPSEVDFHIKQYHGHPTLVATKMKKAKLIAAVNPDEKKMFISIGMKLFGDFVGKSKDVIKNAAKVPNRICGYYIIYLNETDQKQVLEKVQKRVYEMYHRNTTVNHDKSKHENYYSVVSDVQTLLIEENANVFTEQGYECYFLTYNDELDSDKNAQSFLVKPIDLFFELNQSDSNE